MGCIQSRKGERRLLSECTVLGRAPGCDICLGAPASSSRHAMLRWADGRWQLMDLGSRNGSWVNGNLVGVGEPAALRAGDGLSLGCSSESWLLVEDDPPRPFLRSQGGDVSLDGVLALPSAEEPKVVLMRRSNGEWVAEGAEDSRVLVDGDNLDVDGPRYRVFLPSELAPTAAKTGATFCVEDAELHLRHDPTEEHIEAELAPSRGRGVSLGCRAHNVVLLELARARLEDRQRGIVIAEEGWIHREDLSQRLNVPVQHVNIMVYRLRKQLAGLGVVDASEVVQRRAGSGLMRVGTPTVSVGRIGGAE